MGADWAESIDYLEAMVAIMKVACNRLAISDERAAAQNQ
jgi:hypothetical protein